MEGVEGGVDTLECNKATTSSFITIEKDYDSVSGICEDAVADLPDNLPDSISEMKEASVPTLPPTLPGTCHMHYFLFTHLAHFSEFVQHC